MIKLLFITAILGVIKNYIKYKKLSFCLFLRSPILTLLIYLIIKSRCENALLWAIILERWILLLYKSIISYFRNDYVIKMDKYKKKYNLKYLNKK